MPIYPDPLKDAKNGPPPQYEPITTLGEPRGFRGFHFLDPLGGLGMGSSFAHPGPLLAKTL